MRTKYGMLFGASIIGIFISLYYLVFTNDIASSGIFLLMCIAGLIIGAIKLENIDKNTPVSEEELDKLHSFGREQEGSYSDWFEFSIVPLNTTKRKGEVIRWSFQLFNEVDGKTIFVRWVDNMKQLKDVYKGITDKELE